MASASESSLICKLESTDCVGIYPLFSDYLHPFDDLRKPKGTKKSAKANEEQSLVRSLAKKYLSFLNRCLSILPKRLSELSKSGGGGDLAHELFQVYNLCLDCLDSVASQLACKPYSVELMRLRMMHCLEVCGRYDESEIEGLKILERIRFTRYASKSVRMKNKFLPEVDKSGGDKDFCVLVVETTLTLVKCAAMGRSQDGGCFRRVLDLVEEVWPWLRVLDASTYENLQRTLAVNMGKCSLNLVEKETSIDVHLLKAFCCATLTEYVKSSLKDRVYRIAHTICSSLFKLQENKSLCIIDILDHVAHECQVEEETGIDYVELVSYCVNKCQIANAAFCIAFAAHLNKIAEQLQQVMTPVRVILRLYIAGLLLISCDLRPRDGDLASSGGAKFQYLIGTLLDNENMLRDLPIVIGTLCGDLDICSNVKEKDLPSQISTLLDSTYVPYYLNALKFFSQPLAKSINSERKQLVAAKDGASAMNMLSTVLDAFLLLCHLIFSRPSITIKRDGIGFDENCRTLLNVAVAAYTLSIKSKLYIQKSARLIKQIVASEHIQKEGRNYIIACLYNIAVVLHRNKEAKEASKVLSLCCKASWICIKCYCGGQLRDEFVEFVNEAYTRSALLLDILNQVDYHKVRKKIVSILKNWCSANDQFENLATPMPIVKQWVKMECKRVKHVDEKNNSVTLYCLLSSSTELSKRSIGMILEQELTAYEEMSFTYPELCQYMQMKITGILLQDVYVNRDSCFQKAQTLVRKGKALRVCGIERLKDCIQCFSEAIIMIKEISCETHTTKNSLDQQLLIAYCLRALCIMEAEPSSQKIFEDVKEALNLFLSFYILDCCDKEEGFALSDNTVILLYNMIDLLQLKGFMELYSDSYRLMIRLFKLKNLSTQKWLALLWESRRISHALCVSPVDEEFILNSSEHFEELCSFDFWIRYLQGFQPLVMGFQQNFSFLFANLPRDSYHHMNSFQIDIEVDDIRKVASELMSSVPDSNHSAFVAGCLYYDLCTRLISSGQLTEALSFAKEAQRLRAKLFQGKFMYTVQQQAGENKELSGFSHNLGYIIENFRVNKSVAREVLLFNSLSWDLKDGYLSPWKIMQCYLESTLQVGIIHEMIGNGAEAETSLQWGKALSCRLKISLFMVAFSLILGKLYAKKQLWDLAEKELQSSDHILKESCTSFCCSKCKLTLEATLHQYYGDLCQSRFDSSTGDIPVVTAENWYRSALDKLNLSDWKNPLTCPQDDSDESTTDFRCGACKSSACFTVSEENVHELKCMREEPETKIRTKQTRKNKNSAKCLSGEKTLVLENNSRLTRSRYRSSQNQLASSLCKSKVSNSRSLEGNHISLSDQSDILFQKESVLKDTDCNVPSRCGVTCKRIKMRCWHCIPHEIMKSGIMKDFIHLKWEFVRRQLSMKLLTQLGNSLAYPGQIDDAHNILLRRISVLVSRNSFCQKLVPVALDYFRLVVAKESRGDVFAIERAEILHDICWFFLRSYHSKHLRTVFSDISCIKFEDLASWLMLAFVLSREVPVLFQKVSRLLAVIYIVSASSEQFSLSSFSKALGENYWASYFHQASIGTHLAYQFCSNLSGRCKVVQPFVDAEIKEKSEFAYNLKHCYHRLAPETTLELEEYVKNFLVGLPSTAVVSISLLGRDYTSLLQELLLCPTCVDAWVLVSRFSFKTEPVVMLLPVDSISEEEEDDDDDHPNSGLGTLSDCENSSKQWHCPWGFTVIDDVVPAFKTILEGNYLSSVFPLEDTKRNRMLWWKWRTKLDQRLNKLLRNIEDSWFGSWKYLLLGEWMDHKNLDLAHKKLLHDLRSKCKLDVNEGILKVILGGSKNNCEGDTWISQLCFKKGCYIAKVGYCDDAWRGILLNAANGSGTSSELAFQILNEALNVFEVGQSREPIILVLDYDIQMLPWENLPVLRNQEVYRMPSVSSISALLNRSSNHHKQVDGNSMPFPLIDPLDAFYLLNPDGDLTSTQTEFENWFRSQNLEGKAGLRPTLEELVSALKSHDLFIYFGHGSGAQYISRQEIQKLDKCGATLLMGCSSGSLTLHGSYAPQGIPLSYLLAGSPAIVANLWEVTDKDIDRFGKAMLDAWLKERLNFSGECLQCNSLSEEFEAMNLKGKGKAKKKVSRKKALEECESDIFKSYCDHRPKIASFMCQAREACTLPFLIGAAPVCYGVPTRIWRKNNL
ncbi:separase isoform X2 [Prosopis cineraria]|uniref:separase isoform X2 n=1 Tax=Prosopis cineraria TaxID=364024 RepID=UPI0024103495|nr:separase isoform X2 [Prosopis cineraria]